MLTSLKLNNFRGFHDHALPLRDLTVVVGRNNAGKSTIVEGLRLLSIVTSRVESLNFRPVPSWLDAPRIYRGVSPDLRLSDFEFETVFFRYGDPPAIVTGMFDSGLRIEVYIGPESSVHAVIFDAANTPIGDKGAARRLDVPLVAILPQVAPLSPDEQILNEDYVRRTMDGRLASAHFRNQLRLEPAAYRRFRQIVEDTWPGVRVQELTTRQIESPVPNLRTTELLLFIRNDDFVAEASRMGHGLQMWLQTMWFLARAPSDATVILDEPDVYMHPDLQRRLVRLVRGRHRQAIIATHSTEIIADVEPENILVVDRARAASSFASALPEVQEVIDALGGVHNLHLSRLWSARRFLIVEGQDLGLLDPIHRIIFPNSTLAMQNIPSGETQGWSGWDRAVGAARAMRRGFGDTLHVYCLFDSDYRPADAIAERYQRSAAERIRLHVWGRKEIENYLLVPNAIQRLAQSRVGTNAPTITMITQQIELIAEQLREDTMAAIIEALHALDRPSGPSSAYRIGSRWMQSAWGTQEGRWAIVSGKKVLGRLSDWMNRNHGTSFSTVSLARSLEPSDVAEELHRVLDAIETESRIDSRWRVDPTSRPSLSREV